MSVFLRKSTGPTKQMQTQQQPHNRLKRTFYLNLNLSPKKVPAKHTKKYPKQDVENVLLSLGSFVWL